MRYLPFFKQKALLELEGRAFSIEGFAITWPVNYNRLIEHLFAIPLVCVNCILTQEMSVNIKGQQQLYIKFSPEFKEV
jgi:hypothetical protein